MTQQAGEREGRVVRAIPEDTYAHRLMLARAHAGNLSIRAAAERCGLNHASWANWERGMKSRTVVEDAEAISEGLGIDRDWLLHGGPLTTLERRRQVRRAYRRSVLRPPNRRIRRPRRVNRLRAAA